ncbi:MAG: TRAP transporter small permease [Planktomarina sp.]|nr:TRAP transporter small permease [Planktomarina sp.]
MAELILAASNAVDHWVQRITAMFLVILVGLVLLQVVARYIFNSPPIWTEELSRYAMIWAGLLGATISFKQKFDPSLIQAKTTGRLLKLAKKIVSSLAVLIYLIPILWYCVYGPKTNLQRGFLYRHMNTSADVMSFPTIFVAIAVPFAVLVILLHLAARWAEPIEPKIIDRSQL